MLKQIIVHSLPKTHQRNPTTSYYIFNWIHKSIPNRTPYSSNMFSLKTVMYHWAIYKLNFSSHNSTILKTVELVKHKTSRAKKHKVCPTNIWIFLMYPITNRSVQLLKDRHTVQMRGDQQSFSVGVDEEKTAGWAELHTVAQIKHYMKISIKFKNTTKNPVKL